MSSAAHWRALLAEVDQAGLCSNPVRLRGLTLDRTTGELPGRRPAGACKDRRAAVCPSCSRLYAKPTPGTSWPPGIRGGKGVDPAVAEHPQLFVTLTAPSFGPVHARLLSKASVKPCRPRRAEICPHGRSLWLCRAPRGGLRCCSASPLCVECFDYPGAVLWNAHVPRLWVRTSLLLYRAVAAAGGMSDSETRAALRLSYVKVVEFQRRGLVHLHVVLRADGAGGPGDRAAGLARRRGARRRRPQGSRRGAAWPCRRPRAPTFGAGLLGRPDRRSPPRGRQQHRAHAIAAYVAKYATKTVDGTGWLAHPIRSVAQLERLGLPPHLAAPGAHGLGARVPAPTCAHLRLREPTPTPSATAGSSRPRAGATRPPSPRCATPGPPSPAGDGEDDIDFDGEWRFGGRGYAHPDAGRASPRP